jgi:adenosylcobinamide-GDP ribazoletransferase
MKLYLYAFAMCQSMFCAIPAPQVWDEKARDKMLLFLPLVGLEIGLIWAALAWLCRWLELPAMVAALLLCAAPYVLTGFLHLDGFMDVTDAVKSCRDAVRRREILKDSHVGSFAVIGLVLLVLAQFAFFAAAPTDARWLILLLIPAVSRCCSALESSVTGIPVQPVSTARTSAAVTCRGGWVLCHCLVFPSSSRRKSCSASRSMAARS